MPTYDYRCQSCQTEFTVQARMNDPQPRTGPGCTGDSCQIQKRLSRVFGQVAGAYAAPVEKPAVPTAEPARSHVCSKYCDLHK